MEHIVMLSLLVLMFLGSYAIGYIPLVMPIPEKKLKLVSAFGAGLLVGTALAVNIPEGVRALDCGSYSRTQTTPTYARNVSAHSLIGISLVLGFVFMLLVDQCSRSGDSETVKSSERDITATVGLMVHAAADGVALGAAATTAQASVEMTVFITAMLHKAPEAFGLVTFLLHEGLERKRIRRQLIVLTLSAPVTAFVIYFVLGQEGKEKIFTANATGIAILFSASTFLYVAIVHVLPELTSRSSRTHGDDIIQPAVEKKGLNTKELICLIVGTLLPILLTMGHHHRM